MSNVPFLSALYVNAPPIPQQKLFENNVTTCVINFSEYLFSIPCKYPSYMASLNLDLSEVPSSALKKIGLVALWTIFIVFSRALWKAGVMLACVKLLNRSGFGEGDHLARYGRQPQPPSPKRSTPPETTRTKEGSSYPPPFYSDRDCLLSSFVVVNRNSIDSPRGERQSDKGEDLPSPSSLSVSSSFVFVGDEESVDSARGEDQRDTREDRLSPSAHPLSSGFEVVDYWNPDRQEDKPPVSDSLTLNSSIDGSWVRV